MTKFDLARFKEVCEAHRETFDPDYWMSFRQSLTLDLKEAFRSWGQREVAARPATYDEIVSDLKTASARRAQFGATDAQIATIARLAVRDGLHLSQISCSTLTKSEASSIISSF